MFQWRCATAQQVYDKAEEIANHIESTRLSNPSASTPTTCVSSSTAPNSNPTPTCTRLNVGDNVYMIDPTTRCAKKGAITSIVEWRIQRHYDSIPFLEKDKRPAAAAPVKPILAPTPVLALNAKGPGPMDLDGRGHFARSCPSKPMSGHVANVEWSWERPKEENGIEVVSEDEESGKGKAKAN
ncbi:hypothetical protein RhiXN_02425 [Rhizoctonia solani]|uniref:Uncharacterized protein n=1 Tax=Rhizoctonia solani TaxID=456999 RepID=A0A8H8SUV9_9AGAM|nr:uncharacterized protein RhiXN_02425 [Rhizoctonia solani]QRW17503.1 hypothetical protein RhiXN_02425 [Rhizoctonia solani]